MRRPLRNAFLLGVVLGLLAALARARRGTGTGTPSPALPPPVPALVPPAPARAAVPVARAEPAPAVEPAWRPALEGACPEGYPVKAKEGSGIFHVPGGLSYDRTRPDRCYPTPEAAEADGFRPAKR